MKTKRGHKPVLFTEKELAEIRSYQAQEVDCALWAGYMLGLAYSGNRQFDRLDRMMLMRVSWYLRRKAGLK